MGDRSDIEGETDRCHPPPAVSPHGRSRMDGPRFAARRVADEALLAELYLLASRGADPAVLRTYLEEAGAIMRRHLDGPLSEEWAGVFLVHLSQFRALAKSHGISGVFGLHSKGWRRDWDSQAREARRRREALLAPKPREKPSGPVPPQIIPREAQRPRPAKSSAPSEAVSVDTAAAAMASLVEFVRAKGPILVVTGGPLPVEVVAWLESVLGVEGVRIMEGDGRKVKRPRTVQGAQEAIRRGRVSAVLVCIGRTTHTVSGVFVDVAGSAGIPCLLVQRPTRHHFRLGLDELLGRWTE